MKDVVYTIGHSNRTIEEFVDLLHAAGIQVLIDVRRFPGSRRYPHFGGEQLALSLAAAGIQYRHVEALGGRRRPQAGSPNDAWRNAQFRGYADHMDSAEFRTALAEIVAAAAERRQALMCAEAVPWRCHRQLIADALAASGVRVMHILEQGNQKEHQMSPHARTLAAGRLAYPGSGAQLDLL